MVDRNADHGGGGGCEFCSLCICPGYPGDSAGRSEHYCQVKLVFAPHPGQMFLFTGALSTSANLAKVTHQQMACSAILAHLMLNERLNIFGVLGCVLCISGSVTIVLHAPEEREIVSLLQVWTMAMQPGKCLFS